MAMSKRKMKMRNPFHDHPLMRRGGVHERSKKAIRKNEKQKLNKEWCSSMVLIQCYLITPFHVLVA